MFLCDYVASSARTEDHPDVVRLLGERQDIAAILGVRRLPPSYTSPIDEPSDIRGNPPDAGVRSGGLCMKRLITPSYAFDATCNLQQLAEHR